MVKIGVVANKISQKAYNAVFPLRAFSDQIREADLQFQIFHRVDAPGLADCDTVLVFDSAFRQMLSEGEQTREGEIATLAGWRKQGKRVFWFDGEHGTGDVRNYLMPYVDAYLKSHVLKDKMAYQDMGPTGVPPRDYYARQFGLQDDSKTWKGPVETADLKKIQVGWNIGLSDWGLSEKNKVMRRLLRLELPWYQRFARYQVTVTEPNLAGRSLHTSYRVGYHRNRPTVHVQREEIRKRLAILAEQPGMKIMTEGRVDFSTYIEEIKNSMVAISPFGTAEICYRDYEAFIGGALLLKPDVGHFDSYPSYFEPNVTYVPYAWDFSDFEARLLDIIENPGQYEDIAREGQRRFVQSLTKQAGSAFAQHLRSIPAGQQISA